MKVKEYYQTLIEMGLTYDQAIETLAKLSDTMGDLSQAVVKVGVSAKDAAAAISQAYGAYSHAEGMYTRATGGCSYAEGYSNCAGSAQINEIVEDANIFKIDKEIGSWEWLDNDFD